MIYHWKIVWALRREVAEWGWREMLEKDWKVGARIDWRIECRVRL